MQGHGAGTYLCDLYGKNHSLDAAKLPKGKESIAPWKIHLIICFTCSLLCCIITLKSLCCQKCLFCPIPNLLTLLRQ